MGWTEGPGSSVTGRYAGSTSSFLAPKSTSRLAEGLMKHASPKLLGGYTWGSFRQPGSQVRDAPRRGWSG